MPSQDFNSRYKSGVFWHFFISAFKVSYLSLILRLKLSSKDPKMRHGVFLKKNMSYLSKNIMRQTIILSARSLKKLVVIFLTNQPSIVTNITYCKGPNFLYFQNCVGEFFRTALHGHFLHFGKFKERKSCNKEFYCVLCKKGKFIVEYSIHELAMNHIN